MNTVRVALVRAMSPDTKPTACVTTYALIEVAA